MAEALSRIVWLLPQSPTHHGLKIKTLEWSFMPAVLHEQFRVFRFSPLPGSGKLDAAAFAKVGLTKEGPEQMPLCVAIWAKLSEEEAGARLDRGEKLKADNCAPATASGWWS